MQNIKHNFIVGLGILPLLRLIYLGYTDNLSADPFAFIVRSLGTTILLFLIATLAVAPLKRFGLQLVSYRRALGLWAFFYAFLHVLVWVWLDQNWSIQSMAHELSERWYLMLGAISFLMFIPLVLTSNQYAIKLLRKKWKVLHKLTYALVIFAIAHYYFHVASKSNYAVFQYYAIALGSLLLLRVPSVSKIYKGKE